jgi:hypothetical protein
MFIFLDCEIIQPSDSSVVHTPNQQKEPLFSRTTSRLSLKRKKNTQHIHTQHTHTQHEHTQHEHTHLSHPPDHYSPIEITPLLLHPVPHNTCTVATVKRRLFDGGTDTTVGMYYFDMLIWPTLLELHFKRYSIPNPLL